MAPTYTTEATFVRNFTFPVEDVIDNYVLLGDSILRNIDNVNNTQVMAYPGSGLKKMATLLKHNKVPELIGKTMIILHLGTNDASDPKVNENDLLDLTWDLICQVRRVAPTAHLVISQIIPRPKDFAITNDKIVKYNKMLYANSRGWGITTIPSYQTLQFDCVPVESYYKPKDRLHLNKLGVAHLRMCLSKGIAKKRIILGYRRKRRQASDTILRISLAKSNGGSYRCQRYSI